MAKRRNFMVSFSFPVDSAGNFFQQFAPLMRTVENFDIATVEEEVPSQSPVLQSLEELPDLPPQPTSHVVSASPEAPEAPEALETPEASRQPAPRPGNPATSEEARARFRIDQRGIAPTARELLTREFAGRDSFQISEAIKVLERNGLSARTAGPTLNVMKYKGLAEHLSAGRFRILAQHTNGNGSYKGL